MTFSLLGMDTQTGERVILPQAAKRQGTYILGAPGTGKSGLLENLVIDDIKQGLGLCLLDPHGDLIEAVLRRLPGREDDVILLDLTDEEYPFGLNLLASAHPGSRRDMQATLDHIMHLFEHLFEISPRLAHALRMGLLTLLAHPGSTLAELPLLFTDARLRHRLLSGNQDLLVQRFWSLFEAMTPLEQLEYTESLLQKADIFLDPLTVNILGQSQTTIDFRAIMDERKILLVKLDAKQPFVTSLIGATILTQLLTAASTRLDLELTRRKQFNIYADECQRFATPDLATLIAEARKFGIATTLAHQFRSQLKGAIAAGALTAANLIVFRVSGEDAQELKDHFAYIRQPAFLRREEKLTPMLAPASWLAGGHPHSHPAVNAFLSRFLVPTPSIRRRDSENLFHAAEKSLNQWLYEAMVCSDPLALLGDAWSVELLLTVLWHHDYYHSTFSPILAATSGPETGHRLPPRAQRPCPDFGAHYVLSLVRGHLKYEARCASETQARLSQLLAAPDDEHFAEVAESVATFVESILTRHMQQHLIEYASAKTSEKKGTLQAVFDNALFPFRWGESSEPKAPERTGLGRVVGTQAQEAERCQRILAHWMTVERPIFEDFLREVRACVCALNREPISTGSGIYEEVAVGQLSSADAANLIASELTTLADAMARVRIKSVSEKKMVEHTVSLLPPERNRLLWGVEKEQRRENIRAQNLRTGLLRHREEVEEERRRRQTPEGYEANMTNVAL